VKTQKKQTINCTHIVNININISCYRQLDISSALTQSYIKHNFYNIVLWLGHPSKKANLVLMKVCSLTFRDCVLQFLLYCVAVVRKR